jgi:multisubunit Na+/H+ antiporter MnhG subunit
MHELRNSSNSIQSSLPLFFIVKNSPLLQAVYGLQPMAISACSNLALLASIATDRLSENGHSTGLITLALGFSGRLHGACSFCNIYVRTFLAPLFFFRVNAIGSHSIMMATNRSYEAEKLRDSAHE